MHRVIARWACASIAAACLLAAVSAQAAETEYPSRPVRLVVPFAAGGPTDIIGRLYAERMTNHWGRQVLVDSRPGASGLIGGSIVARSNPDGYTVLFGSTSTFSVNQLVLKDIPYDIARDFTFIGLAANGPHVLMVRPGLPVKTALDLIALARKEPGKLKYGSSGTGTIVHMTVELFKLNTGTDILHIPYKGGGPSVIAMIGGEVDLVINDLSVILPHIRSGKGTPLAVSHTARLSSIPNVPTFTELGFPGIVASTWFGVAVPAKTPRAIVSRISTAHNVVVAGSEYKERLDALGMEPLVLTLDEAQRFLQRESATWKKTVETARIKLE